MNTKNNKYNKARGDGSKIDKKVLELLVCPISKTSLILSADKGELISIAAKLAFPIKNGVPLLVIEEARKLSEDELEKLR